MPSYDFGAPRLFAEVPLRAGSEVPLSREQANYLLNVLRLGAGDDILVFNGRDGEWRARIVLTGRRGAALGVGGQTRGQESGPDIDYLFAPLKRARLDYMVQKAVEMGVARLCPVFTRRTVAERVNPGRMRANAIEAAEQCGILRIPAISAPVTLEDALAAWDPARRLIFCDERAEVSDPLAALGRIAPGPLAVLIGPEGGFTPEERDALRQRPFTVPLALGPRILRADTAAVAALALAGAILGDWR